MPRRRAISSFGRSPHAASARTSSCRSSSLVTAASRVQPSSTPGPMSASRLGAASARDRRRQRQIGRPRSRRRRRTRSRARSGSRARARCRARRRPTSASSASGDSRVLGTPSSAAFSREEQLGQERQVAGALAQRRQRHLDDVQPIDRDPRGSAPSAIARGRSRLVAATTRTSTWIGLRGRRRARSCAPGARAAAWPAAPATGRRSRRGRWCRRRPARAGRSWSCARR